MGALDPYPIPDSDAPFYVVFASVGGVSVENFSRCRLDNAGPAVQRRQAGDPCECACFVAGPDAREWIMTMFDASTGEEIGGDSIRPQCDEPAWRPAPSRVLSLASAQIDEPGSAELRRRLGAAPGAPTVAPPPTPSATSTHTPPRWTPLRVEQLSENSRAALDTFPLREGAWWSYELVNRHIGYMWERAVVTETVTAALGAADGGDYSALFRVTTSTDWQFPSRPWDLDRWGGSWRFFNHERLLRDGVFEGAMLPLVGGDTFPALTNWSVEGREEVAVPAGRFTDCFHLQYVISAGAWRDQWFCPGVGIVRDEEIACYTNCNEVSVLQLTDWSGRGASP
jgi:hypothetical protein